MRYTRLAAAASALLFSVGVAAAQHAGPGPFGKSLHGEAFNEGPRQAAYLMSGMSDQVHMPVQGLAGEAQRFFDQGLTQLHGFWFLESERSFRQVAKLVPTSAMAYLGMALANVENPVRASGFIAGAVERSAGAPRYEELWIDAYARYYRITDALRAELRSGDAERVKKAKEALAKSEAKREKDAKQALDRELIKDLGAIVYEFPSDVEAKARLAVQIWLAYDWGGGIPITSHTAIDALLDQVFQAAPLHPAHHYRVHLWDQEKAERALVSASRLGDSAPGIAHQWHMAGHIYSKLDRHAESAWQQEASARVDHAHMMRDRVMPFEIHNYGHNQEWLAHSLSHQGRHLDALLVATNLAELPRHPKRNRVASGDDIAGSARVRLVQLCEDHGLWTDVLRLVDQGVLDACEEAYGDALRIELVGRAFYRLGRKEEAAQVAAGIDPLLVRARAERAKKMDQAEDAAVLAKADAKESDRALEEARRESTDVVRMVFDLKKSLDAERLLAAGDAKGALAAFLAIEGFPKTLLSDAHVAAGEPDKAITLLEAEIKAHPRQFPLLARLAEAYAIVAKPEHEARRRGLAEELAGMRAATSPLLARTGVASRPTPDSAPVVAKADSSSVAPNSEPIRVAESRSFPADFGTRPPHDTLGPVRWSPVSARGFDLPDTKGGRRRLSDYEGRTVVVVFYLGFGCLHCVDQLKAFGPKAKAFADAGIDLVAIGTDSVAGAAASLEALAESERFPFPLLADPELAAFKAWRCFDDFEGAPLHGTFLVDGAGRLRWQDVSFDPFIEIDWLLGESRRLLGLRTGGAEVHGSGGSGSK